MSPKKPFDKPCYILGAGGHAQTVIDTLLSHGCEVAGCLDPNIEVGQVVLGDVKVIGGDEILDGLDTSQVFLFNGIGSVKEPVVRLSVFERYKKAGFEFPSLIHPWAHMSDFSEIGSGSVIQADSVVQAATVVKENVIVNTSVSIDHDCIIEDHSHIAPGAVLCGQVKIGKRCHIGAGVTIIQGVSIEEGAIIGAGVVIKDDVPAGFIIR